jgi:hypothetical protein
MHRERLKTGVNETGPKREGVTGGWRKQRDEELNNLYSSLNIIVKPSL